jgi:serine/threonine protein kinase
MCKGVVHGDIKPQNILIFPSDGSRFRACVSDFGFSIVESMSQGAARLPTSMNWNAPEHQQREFTVEEAKFMDVYSCGLIILRVFFGESFDKVVREAAQIEDAHACGNSELESLVIHNMKKEDEVRRFACDFVNRNNDLQVDIKQNLWKIFNQSLSASPTQRSSMSEIFCGISSENRYVDTNCVRCLHRKLMSS